MFMNKLLLLCIIILPPSAYVAASPELGQPLSAEDVKLWDISVFPDGAGLPPGSGDATTGKLLFERHCASCHGPGAIGLSADALAYAEEPLDSEWPDKTIGSYWPYATTVFDFIRRSMPMTAPGSLSNDEVYALTAYLLYINKLIEADQLLDAKTLAAIRMPNRNGFIGIDAEADTATH
jgi:cytochrome c